MPLRRHYSNGNWNRDFSKTRPPSLHQQGSNTSLHHEMVVGRERLIDPKKNNTQDELQDWGAAPTSPDMTCIPNGVCCPAAQTGRQAVDVLADGHCRISETRAKSQSNPMHRRAPWRETAQTRLSCNSCGRRLNDDPIRLHSLMSLFVLWVCCSQIAEGQKAD